MLSARGLHATYYINSGEVDNDSNHMNSTQLHALESDGNEIGGHTIDHTDLTTVEHRRGDHEVCDDRTALLAQGLRRPRLRLPLRPREPHGRTDREELRLRLGSRRFRHQLDRHRSVGLQRLPVRRDHSAAGSVRHSHSGERARHVHGRADRDVRNASRTTRRRLGAARVPRRLRQRLRPVLDQRPPTWRQSFDFLAGRQAGRAPSSRRSKQV